MPDPDKLDVNNIYVTEQPQFLRGGQIVMQKRVSFYVGTHGPFTLSEDKDTSSAAAIQAAIDRQVLELRNLLTSYGTTSQSGG